MERGVIEVDPRHTTRRMRTAMQGDVVRALIELITNSDDSYARLEARNKRCNGVIEVVYRKEGRSVAFAVRDFAEGMSIDEVRNSFKRYGGATSGMKIAKKVRGFFGQGAKDALTSMIGGRVCTFKRKSFIQCKLYFHNDQPMYEISGPDTAAQELRELHKISRNGTVAYFKADRRRTGSIPRFNTIHERLANNYLLRKIMTNRRRKVFLLDEGTMERRRLRYRVPKGKEILREKLKITYGRYGKFPVRILVRRAGKDLSQTSGERDGGLLILDEEDVVLDISLFRYDNEPLAARFFGEVKVGRFRELLENEEPVLTEERIGLVRQHTFCQNLVQEIEKRLDRLVKEEMMRRQRENQTRIDREEAVRYKKAFSIFNEIARAEPHAVISLGRKTFDQLEKPPDGFSLYSSSTHIPAGRRFAIELQVDTKVVRPGSTVKVRSTNPKIRVMTPETRISKEDGTGLLRKYITIEAAEPFIKGTLEAHVGKKSSQVEIFVVPEKALLLVEGMTFEPETMTLRPNQPRKVELTVYDKIIKANSRITVSSDNPSVHISQKKITVSKSSIRKHLAKYELVIWGDETGQTAYITARHKKHRARLEVHITSKEEQGARGRTGMFSEPEFSYDPEPLQRTSYSAETGHIIIYINFPSLKHYLGKNSQYRNTLPAQVLIADLVAERCFYEVAKRKLEYSGSALRPEEKADRIQRDARELSRRYGKKVHEALVDEAVLHQARSIIGSTGPQPGDV